MLKPMCRFLNVLQNLLKNVAGVMPQFGTSVLPCDPSCNNVQYIMYAPSTPTQLQGPQPLVIDWTPTTGLVTCHVQAGPAHGPW